MKPKKPSSFVPIIVFAAGAILAGVTPAHADQTWTGATSADWNTATNWTSAVPAAADVAVFDATSTANLATTLGANSTAAGITLTSPAAAVSVTSAANTAFSPFAAVTAAAATDVFTYTAANAHPLINGDRVAFTGTLPTGITAAGSYFVINATATAFQVSATAGGAALNFTTDSAAMFVDGLIVPANATDTFAFGAAFYSSPLPNGSLVSFTAGTGPTGLTIGANYYVINSTATTFQVATVSGGAPVDITTDGATVRAFPNNSPQLTVGGSGFNLATATFGLTVASPVIATSPQTWEVASGQTLTLTGAILSSAEITKAGAGAVALSNANQLTAGLRVNAGTVITRNNLALVNSPLTLGNGTTYRYERQGTAGSFPNQPITVAPSANVTLTTDNAANGYNGLISGDDTSTLNIGAAGALVQCSFASGGNIQQFANFTGTVKITDGASIRFSSTSNLNNGGAQTIFDTGLTGNLTTRNGGTINLGELKGSGTVTGAGGADGTAIFSVGGKSTDSVFGGILSGGNNVARNAALTKVGSGKLSLTGLNTYTGATIVNGGILEFNNTKSGAGATTVNTGATLGGSGSLAGTTTVTLNGRLAPGDSAVANGIGTITHNSLTLATGSYLDLEFFGGANDKIVVPAGGTLALNPGIQINPTAGKTQDMNPFATNGTYPIIHVAGATVTGFNSSTFAVVDYGTGKSFTFVNDGTDISLVVSDSSNDPANHWIVDGNGSWNLASHWSKGTVPNAAKAFANFGPYLDVDKTPFTQSPEITLDGNRTVGEVTLEDPTNEGETRHPFTIAQGTSGSLLLDNGTFVSNIVSVHGDHFITAPVSVDAEGAAVDVGTAATLAMPGVIGGTGAITKTGVGLLSLSGANTFNGGLFLQAGTTRILNLSNLGAGSVTFTGGTLSLGADVPVDSHSYRIAGTASASFDSNGFNHALAGGVLPADGATGGLVKKGLGTLVLTGASAYTGTTTVEAGVLEFATGAENSIGGAYNTAATGGKLVVSGGTLTAAADSFIASGSGGLLISAGTATYNAGLLATSNSASNYSIIVNGGTLNAGFIRMGRGVPTIGALPAAGTTTSGFYMTGGTANVTGGFSVGYSNSAVNSSASARLDGGTLTVGGRVEIALAGQNRWSVLDVNGGTFVSTDTVAGVEIGGTLATENAAFLVRAGTATVERLLLQQAAASTTSSVLNVTGGSLYVGSGGIVGNTNGGAGVLSATFGAATLGGTADWTSLLPLSVAGTTIRAADAESAPHNIALAGAVSGTDLTKTGGGILTLAGTNSYTGLTAVAAGTLRVDGDSSAATGAVTVAVGATLGGIGTVGGAVTVDGSVAPGSPTGTLGVPSAVFNTGSALEIQLDGAATPQNGKQGDWLAGL